MFENKLISGHIPLKTFQTAGAVIYLIVVKHVTHDKNPHLFGDGELIGAFLTAECRSEPAKARCDPDRVVLFNHRDYQVSTSFVFKNIRGD